MTLFVKVIAWSILLGVGFQSASAQTAEDATPPEVQVSPGDAATKAYQECLANLAKANPDTPENRRIARCLSISGSDGGIPPYAQNQDDQPPDWDYLDMMLDEQLHGV